MSILLTLADIKVLQQIGIHCFILINKTSTVQTSDIQRALVNIIQKCYRTKLINDSFLYKSLRGNNGVIVILSNLRRVHLIPSLLKLTLRLQ